MSAENKKPQTPVETAGDAIVAALVAGGVDHLFFTSGSEIGFYQEAIAKSRALGHNAPMRLVTVPLEHVSLNAAIGYAAVSGKPAATAAHVDCGTQHYGGALHTAWRMGVPVILTAGYAPTAVMGSMPGSREEGGHIWMQENYDQNGIVRNYTKWQRQLTYMDHPGTTASRAVQVARSEPTGPVYLTVPKELALMPVRDARFPLADQLGIARPSMPDPASIEELARKLAGAQQPVVVVSGSGRNPASVPALVELCEKLGIAVTDSVSRCFLSFPFDHALFQQGYDLKNADVVFVLEADVPWVPGRNGPRDDAWIASLSVDPAKTRFPMYEFTANLRLQGDALLTIRALSNAADKVLTDADHKRITERAKALAASSAKRRAELDADAKAKATTSPIDPAWASHVITNMVDENCILLDDTISQNPLGSYVRQSRPGSYIKNTGSSGGWGAGAAFGAKLAAPDKDIIAVSGDGFYMFGTPAPALWAARQHNAPFLMIVYTNRSYTTGTASVKRTFGADSYAAKAGFEGGYFDPPIDFAKEAEATGAYGENVRDPADLEAALKRGLVQVRAGKPAVISIWMKRIEGED